MAGDSEGLENKLPRKLLDYLMPFQKSGVQFAVEKNGKCLIADEMGLGKTVQAIAVACYYREDWPLLVIMPSSLKYPWLEELEKWLPGIHPHDIHLVQGGGDSSGIGQAKISLVTFGLLSCRSSVLVKEALMNQKFKVVIVDESHYIKNFRTACSQAVVPLVKQADRRILLSGTPSLARPVELYPQLEALCPGKFGNWWTFTSKYCDAKVQYFGKQRRRKVDGASNLEELQSRLVSEVMIRREKKEVLSQLPPKQRQRILFNLKDSPLKTEILETFELLLPYLSKSGPDLSKASYIQLSGKCRGKLCDTTAVNKTLHGHTSDTDTSKQPAEKSAVSGEGETRVTMLSLISKLYKLTGDAKIGPVKDYVSLLCESPNLKFLVFAYHHNMMDGIQQTLWEKGMKFIRIDGTTKPSDRLYYVQQFQGDPDCRVAILSILAAGVGLTFTAAKLVVFSEMYWTPGVMIQCEDRAHRIGQTSCVPTTVVTATLNGRVQNLEAAQGDDYQVKVLSNAEAWLPSDSPTHCDITSMFLSQQVANQKSIKDFFHGSQEPKTDNNCSSMKSPSVSTCQTNETSIKGANSGLLITLSDDSDFSAEESVVEADKNKSVLKKREFVFGKRKRASSMSATAGYCKRMKSDNTNASSLQCYVERLANTDCDEEDFTSDKHTKKLRKTKGHFTHRRNTKLKCQSQNSDTVFDGEKWGCSVCTFLNHTSLSYCEMCDSPKQHSTLPTTIKPSPGSDSSQSVSCQTQVCDKYGSAWTSGTVSESSPSANNGRCKDNITEMSAVRYHGDINVSHFQKDYNRYKVDSKDLIDPGMDILLPDIVPRVRNVGTPHHVSPPSRQTIEGADPNVTCAPHHVSPSTQTIEGADPSVTHTPQHVSPSTQTIEGADPNVTCAPHNVSPSTQTIEGADPNVTCAPHHVSPSTQTIEGADPNVTCAPHNVSPSTQTIEGADPNVTCAPHHVSPSTQTIEGADPNVTCAPHHVSPSTQTIEGADPNVTCAPHNVSPSIQTIEGVDPNVTRAPHPASPPSAQTIQGSDCKESNNQFTHSESDMDRSDCTLLSVGSKHNEHGRTVKSKNGELVRWDHSDDSGKDDISLTQDLMGGDTGDWLCLQCNLINLAREDCCEGCLASKPKHQTDVKEMNVERREINLDCLPVYPAFHYCCSKYTGRIYLFDQNKCPLDVNFLPLDVSVGNTEALPDLLLHPDNMRLIQRFLHQWNSLSETKRRYLVKHAGIFDSPCKAYEHLKSGKPNYSINRHLTKEACSMAAVRTADCVGGSVRVINRPTNNQKTGQSSLQVLGSDGIPLCLNCEKPYENELLKMSTIQLKENAWYMRFCSAQCSHTYWMKTHNDYCREEIFSIEHGVCQLCSVDAHAVYRQIKATSDVEESIALLKETPYNKLKTSQKIRMIKQPTPGLFWHVDHIIPVWEGGGECDIDNLRTLCTPCHQSVTSEQTRRRVRRPAVNCRDITSFFKPS